MSKVRIPINPMQVGRVGAYSMYVRSGEQIVRQRKNSSNYGPEASRTESQMTRRVKWSSLVNFYKICSVWMPKAYETLKQGQTVYNKFMQININKAHCALTKDMAQNGCCCIENWTVSQGSLSPIEYGGGVSGIGIISNIKLTTAISAVTTVKSLSEDIIATNPTFQNGDNIAMVWFRNYLDNRQYPFAVCEYFEFTLDTGNTALLNTTEAWDVIQSAGTTGGDFLATKAATVEANNANAWAWIHTRKVGGQLKVSTQDIYYSSDDYVDPFTTTQAVQAAIDSYGLTEEVPLDPSFSSAVISKVLWNGSVIYQRGVSEGRFRIQATEGGELEIQGTGLNSRDVRMSYYDGTQTVEFTPLETTASSLKYILTANGNYTLVENKYVLGSLALSGIEPPEELKGQCNMRLYSTTGTSGGQSSSIVGAQFCVNYTHLANESYPYYQLNVQFDQGTTIDMSKFTLHNCTKNSSEAAAGPTAVLNLSPTDAGKVAYVDYEGFIVAVFNYS